MAVSPQIFPPRKRRPSAGSFISPSYSDLKLVQSLFLLSQDISSFKPLQFLLKRSSSSIIRKTKLLAILFEELLRTPIFFLPRSAILCFEEIHIVLQRIKTLLEDCSNGSQMWLLMQIETVSNNFRELTVELSTLLDIFPLKEFDLNEDVKEMVVLIRKQCFERKFCVDPIDKNLRYHVLNFLEQIKNETVPDQRKLERAFERLGVRDAHSCKEEIDRLEEELQNRQVSKKSLEETIALISLVRYAKCVLFGASSPRSDDSSFSRSPSQVSEMLIPVDFRCPISLDLMRDPVVVATGQTYDRTSILHWIESGHNTCPKTGQLLEHKELVSNRALKNLISLWCREQKIPFELTETSYSGSTTNKTALEATKMTASFLVDKLTVTTEDSAANRLVYELRLLAKMDSDNRGCIAEAGAIPCLLKYLDSGNSSLQLNAVTTMLNLSLLELNKKRIMETNGALDGIIEVLRSGATWEAKENAAATIFSLSGVHEYRKKLGRKSRVVKGLMELAKTGPNKKDAVFAILNLAGEREAIGRLIEGGVVELAVEVVEELPEEGVAILAAVAKRGGVVAVVAVFRAIRMMAVVLRDGPERARESAAAALVSVCRRGGRDVVAELAGTAGIERAIWELMAAGTVRARRKAGSLLRILRRWASGMEDHTIPFSAHHVQRMALHS